MQSDRNPCTATRPHRQIDVTSARKILGLIGRNYNDEQMATIVEHLYGLAEITYHFLEKGGDQG